MKQCVSAAVGLALTLLQSPVQLNAQPAADGPPASPILRIEPGMHIARINRIGVDATCTLLATGSDDKTVRLWALPEFRLLRTLRLPIGFGHGGKVYAVAMAPDSRWVAAGGFFNPAEEWIYIFDATSGQIVRQLGPLGEVPHHLAVSPDGSHLAATLGNGEGVRVWDTTDWRLLVKDNHYGGKDAYGAAFDRQGALYTVARDGRLRRYKPGRDKPVSVKTKGGREPFSVAVHPAGKRVAVGFNGTTAVEVYDARTLAPSLDADTAGVKNGDLSKVAWSADGARLYAGGSYYKGGRYPILVWDRAGAGAPRDLAGPLNTIMHLLPCGDGMAFGAADPAFGILTPAGDGRLWQVAVNADLREDFLISDDGQRVRFRLKVGSGTPLLFDLAAERVENSPAAPQSLRPAQTQSLPVSDWINDTIPKLAGKPLPLEANEMSRSLAITPDAGRFVLGADWSLHAYTTHGQLMWSKAVPGAVWGVNIAREGRLIVAAYGDGTIRWHRFADGKELLALFVHAEDRRWVAWTPKGYYTASAGGESFVGWHVNRGWHEPADFFPAEKFRDQFHRPDIVKLVLDTLDEDQAVALANGTASRPAADTDIRTRLPPVIDITAPSMGASFSDVSVTIRYVVRSPSDLRLTRIKALIDGVPAANTKGVIPIAPPGGQKVTGSLTLTLPARAVTVALIAETESSESEPARVSLKWAGAAPSVTDLEKPTLATINIGGLDRTVYGTSHALLISVGKQASRAWEPLTNVHMELDSVEAALIKQGFQIERLLDPTGEQLSSRLKKFLVESGGEQNGGGMARALVYFSGHGWIDRSAYTGYIVPEDAPSPAEDLKGFRKAALSMTQLQALVADAQVHHLLFVFDSCFSGSVFYTRSDSDAPNRLEFEEMIKPTKQLLTAGNEEQRVPGISEFTPAFVDGIEGKADENHDGIVAASELHYWLRKTITPGGKQTPRIGKVGSFKEIQGDFIFLPRPRRGSSDRGFSGHLKTLRPE